MRFLNRSNNHKSHYWSVENEDTHCKAWTGKSFKSSKWSVGNSAIGSICRVCIKNTIDNKMVDARNKKRRPPQTFSEKTIAKQERKRIKKELRKPNKLQAQTITKLDFGKSKEFLISWEWRTLRYKVLLKYERRCMCCGASPSDGTTVLHVDHIKPRSKYPELALDGDNLQVLCGTCNQGKGAWDEGDFRQDNVIEWDQVLLAKGARERQ